MTIVSLDIRDGTMRKRRFFRRKRFIIPTITVIIILVIIAVYVLTRQKEKIKLSPPNPTEAPPPSTSQLRHFPHGAVSSDSLLCSNIGKEILERHGSVVDSTIATMFCIGLVTMQSMGIGGGFLMTIYTNGTAYSLDARESAPLAATSDMFSNETQSKIGALAVGVPGELKGYIEAHKRFGMLPWSELVEPSIKICKNGFNISKHQSNSLKLKLEYIRKDPVLKELFFNSNGSVKKEGDLVVHEKFCQTLEIIRDEPESFYNGSLAKNIVSDIKEMGGIITEEDLLSYKAKWRDPVEINIGKHRFISVPPPGSGNILGFILNILKGYNLTEVNDTKSTILTFHRAIEAFKFALAQKTFLGDSDFVNITLLLKNLTSDYFAQEIRNQIKDNKTWNVPEHYGAHSVNKDDHGTAHISVLAPNGDAVSVTSTVNLYFGASITSNSTGILLNSGMDDFSVEGFKNYFGLPFAETNKIEPGKRPLSSMSPAIILDGDGNVRLVIGAAGGTKIPTSVALAVIRNIWFGEDLKRSIDAPRFHNQVFPMSVSYDYGILDDIVVGLEKLGHVMERAQYPGSVINAVSREGGSISGNADYRKGGDAAGL